MGSSSYTRKPDLGDALATFFVAALIGLLFLFLDAYFLMLAVREIHEHFLAFVEPAGYWSSWVLMVLLTAAFTRAHASSSNK